MKILILLMIVAVAGFQIAAGVTLKELAEDEWEAFKVLYGKKYGSETEERFRMKIYLDNRQQIARHNKKGSFKLAMNKYGDLLQHEFTSIMSGDKQERVNSTQSQVRGANFLPPEGFVAPPQVDWRKNGFVTPVKNQGDCGASWAFAAAGAVEGQHKRKTGELVPLSAQNLLDCDDFNFACKGGFSNVAFEYIRDTGGIDTEVSYPYTGDGHKLCRYNQKDVGATVTGYVNVQFENETALMIAVASVGPVTATIDNKHASFRFYAAGIYWEEGCTSKEPDMGDLVLIVGYGTEDGYDYWLAKNSWGTDWGEDGYFRIARNFGNMCGIATFNNYPLV